MTRQNTTTTVEIHSDDYWPDEAQLAEFVEQAGSITPSNRAEMVYRMALTDRTWENNAEYAALYFVA